MRIALITLTLSASSLLLSGCVTPPPAQPVAPTKSAAFVAERLVQLGFEKTEEGYLLNLDSNVLFDTGKSELKPEARQRIESVAGELVKLEIARVRVLGHTDNVGSVELNAKLSSDRARAVANVLEAASYRAENIEALGLGFSRPIASNDTPEGRQKNRRVNLVIPF